MAQPVETTTIMTTQPFWINGQTDRQTDGRYQMYYLPCFGVDKKQTRKQTDKLYQMYYLPATWSIKFYSVHPVERKRNSCWQFYPKWVKCVYAHGTAQAVMFRIYYAQEKAIWVELTNPLLLGMIGHSRLFPIAFPGCYVTTE